MVDIVLDNKVVIFGNGDLAHEFAYSSNKNIDQIVFIDREIDRLLDYRLLQKAKEIFICISEPKIRQRIFIKLKKFKLTVNTYVSDKALISKNVKIGEGVIIQAFCVISNNVIVEDCVFMNFACIIGHDVSIGEFSSLMPNSNVNGHSTLGKRVYLSTGSIVIPGKKLCDDVKVGVNSTIIKSLNKSGTYFGNPAELIT